MQLNILAAQIVIPPMTTAIDRDRHLKQVATALDDVLTLNTVDLVVLPELSTIDYSRTAFEHLHELAEPVHGPSYHLLKEVAVKHKCWLVYGFAHTQKDGYSISSAVLNPKGEIAGVYNKLHLAQFGDSMEKEYFTAGDQRLVVFDVNGFKVAPIICYDIRAPELCRTLAIDHQVDVVLHTGAYARDPSFYSWHAFAMTRAVENQVYFLSLNRAGKHFGHSAFYNPWVDEHSPPHVFNEHAEDFQLLTLCRKEITAARTEYTFLKDRLTSYALPLCVHGSE